MPSHRRIPCGLLGENPKLLPIGTPTRWGKIRAVLWTGGERFYHMVDRRGGIAMMPAGLVEATVAKDKGEGNR